MTIGVTLEVFSEARARLDRGDERARVLSDRGLTEAAWEAAEADWLERLADEVDCGKFDLCRRYVEAYRAAGGDVSSLAVEEEAPLACVAEATPSIQPASAPGRDTWSGDPEVTQLPSSVASKPAVPFAPSAGAARPEARVALCRPAALPVADALMFARPLSEHDHPEDVTLFVPRRSLGPIPEHAPASRADDPDVTQPLLAGPARAPLPFRDSDTVVALPPRQAPSPPGPRDLDDVTLTLSPGAHRPTMRFAPTPTPTALDHDQFVRIAAELSLGGDRAAVLARFHLREDQWQSLGAPWLARVRSDPALERKLAEARLVLAKR